MLKGLLVFIVLSMCSAQKATPHVLYGLFSGNDTNYVYYGSIDLDLQQFNKLNSLNIDVVGDPNRIKYSSLPFTYNPYADVVYMAASDRNDVTKLSVINAINGSLISVFTAISYPIVSLHYDIFQNKLFGHMIVDGSLSYIAEINTTDGTIKRLLKSFDASITTSISTYSPTTGEYFFTVTPSLQQTMIILNTNNPINYTTVPIDVSLKSMRFDYKTSSMYVAYVEEPDEFVSSIGILDRKKGDISVYIGNLAYDSNHLLTSISTYDIAKNIYYVSCEHSTSSNGIIYIDIDTTEVTMTDLPESLTKSHGWFVKQFGDKS